MAKKDWMINESEIVDDVQINVLQATLDKSCIVSGCAGSGKSVLALIKAQRIQEEKGNNYQIIVFTKALCRYMNAGREQLKLTKVFDYYWEWKKRGCPSSDYIIVDEIQDFSAEEITEFIQATKKNFFFFGDTAQSIYDGLKRTMPVQSIIRLFPIGREPKNWELYRNYRLPLPVAKIARYVGIGIDGWNEDVYQSIETITPRIVKYHNLKFQITAIAEIIKKLNLTDVGILVPHNEDILPISEILNKLGCSHEKKYNDKDDWRNSEDSLDFTTTNPKLMTYHSAKGLQFESVFLPNIGPLSTDPDRAISEQKALYVAMTRTYRHLYIMYSGELPYPLSDIPRNLYRTTVEEEVEDK